MKHSLRAPPPGELWELAPGWTWSWVLTLLVTLVLAFDGDKPQPGTHLRPSPLSPPGHSLGDLWHFLPLMCFTSQCAEDGKQGFLRGPVL